MSEAKPQRSEAKASGARAQAVAVPDQCSYIAKAKMLDIWSISLQWPESDIFYNKLAVKTNRNRNAFEMWPMSDV